jgi:hypothetical protein
MQNIAIMRIASGRSPAVVTIRAGSTIARLHPHAAAALAARGVRPCAATDEPQRRSTMRLTMKRPSHGTIAGYLGLMLGVVALTGGTAVAAGMLNGKMIQGGSIKASKLAKNSVTSVKLHKGSVTNIKLAKNAVSSLTIRNHAVTAAKLGPNAVTSVNVTPGSLQASDLTPGALASFQGAPGRAAVTTSTLADGAVTAAKLADGSVTGTKVPLKIVTVDGVISAASLSTKSAMCAEGARAFGGGVTIDDTSVLAINSDVRQSQPAANAAGDPVGWSGTVVGLAGLPNAVAYHVYAICG